MKCNAITVRLNCGCCEDTFLGCGLELGHDGDHEEQREEYGSPLDGTGGFYRTVLAVKWRELAREKRN